MTTEIFGEVADWYDAYYRTVNAEALKVPQYLQREFAVETRAGELKRGMTVTETCACLT